MSDRFLPSIGGVQTVTRLLGEAFVRSGLTVTVLTREPNAPEGRTALMGGRILPDPLLPGTRKRARDREREAGCHHVSGSFSFKVWRRPGPLRVLREYMDASAVIVQGPAARLAWPLCLIRRRTLMVHHMLPGSGGGWLGGWMRGILARRVRHAAVSGALACKLPWPAAAVLPNPYDDAVFRLNKRIERGRDVIFVGRLIPEKGAHVLVEALAALRRLGAPATATIVGEGPELQRLTELTAARKVGDCVRLPGQVRGAALAELLNQHRVLVVPSLHLEAFGVVALEGIACGCVALGSNVGGVPEAIGPCGTTFMAGNADSLAARLRGVLGSKAAFEKFRADAERHLAFHSAKAVAQRYLELLVNDKIKKSWPQLLVMREKHEGK